MLAVLGMVIVASCSSSGASSTASEARPGAPRTAVVSTAATTSTATARTSAAAAHSKNAALPLAGKVVGIDPGHNGRNYTDPAFLNHQIWNGHNEEGCDTTGTQTDSGYTEAQFNFNVATYLTADLRAEGAKVVLTRKTNDGIGPCVNERAWIINRAHSDVAIDIHADGGPPGGRGFAILEPVPDGPNDHVISASERFARILRARYSTVTSMPVSTYDGVDGFQPRFDLAGLNLTTVPKVLIECGNMRNATDAELLVRSSFQRRAARAFTEAIRLYLTGRD